jgi:hypothetical protein
MFSFFDQTPYKIYVIFLQKTGQKKPGSNPGFKDLL